MSDMLQRFASGLPTTATVVFYYAGHGLQIDGRNYLLPVDAHVDGPADVLYGGFDVANLLKQFQERADPKWSFSMLAATIPGSIVSRAGAEL